MYTKVFRQIYDGTLTTNGPWQALVTFQQLLILANDAGEVDMTMGSIARTTTIPMEIIELGIATLLQPDLESRTPDEQGRRIVPLSENRSWGWRIVNYIKYRSIQKEEERRDYHRRYYHDVRKKKDPQQFQQSSIASTVSTDTEAYEEEDTTPKPPRGGRKVSPWCGTHFEAFWLAYPKKVGKDAAAKAFAKRKPDDTLLATMVEAIEQQKRSASWQKDGGQYIPNPTTWLNQGRWQDEEGDSGQSSLMAGAI